jgi:hypothetical protein
MSRRSKKRAMLLGSLSNRQSNIHPEHAIKNEGDFLRRLYVGGVGRSFGQRLGALIMAIGTWLFGMLFLVSGIAIGPVLAERIGGVAWLFMPIAIPLCLVAGYSCCKLAVGIFRRSVVG